MKRRLEREVRSLIGTIGGKPGAIVVGANVGGTVVPASMGATVTVTFPVVVDVVVPSVAFASVTFNFLILAASKPFFIGSAGSAAGVSQCSPVRLDGHSHPPWTQSPGPQSTPKHASMRTQYASSGCAAQYVFMTSFFFCKQSSGLLHAKSPGGGGDPAPEVSS